MKDTIVVENLSWRPDKEDDLILKEISCVFKKGNIYGIIGPNGSGKTSLIKNILKFVDAESGSIELDAVDLKAYRRNELAKKIALVPQNTSMECAYSVYDIVMMGRTPYQKRFADATSEDKRIVFEAMELTDCWSLKDKDIFLLSGGESQRVITARAIAQDTNWLILDEPISNLDVKHQVELMTSLVKLKETKDKSVIAVLHDINIAAVYCNQIIMMKDGKIHSQGRTEEVLTKENLLEVYDIEFEILEDAAMGRKYYIPVVK